MARSRAPRCPGKRPTGVSAALRRAPAAVPGRIKITGLWLSRGEDGREFLEGSLSPSVNILVFKNGSEGQGGNQPSHVMYLAPAGRGEPGTPVPDGFFGGAAEADEDTRS